MRNSKMKKITIFLIVFCLLRVSGGYSCTMFRLTVSGKTLIGNNEDFSLPYTRLWVEPASNDLYGVLFFGFNNNYPQGGMNEKGLVFDGFSTSEFPIKNTKGKKQFNGNIIEAAMRSCATVEEVKAFVLQYDLSRFVRAQLMFADAQGHSIILEGDEIIHSTAPYQITTNFYQSRITDKNEITCRRYKTAERLLSGNPEPTIEFCSTVLDSVHADGYWGGTQYSNVYDPAHGVVYLYLFHNFNECVKIDLQEELAKGSHITVLADLFKEKERYLTYKSNYLEANELVNLLLSERDTSEISNLAVRIRDNEQTKIFSGRLTRKADLLLSNKKYYRALGLFKLVRDLYPDSWHS